jgi:hypothetical protein
VPLALSSSSCRGVAIAECLGDLFTGAWTVLLGVAMLRSSVFEPWLAWPGLVIGLFLVAGSPVVGSFEGKGWTPGCSTIGGVDAYLGTGCKLEPRNFPMSRKSD